VNTKTRGVIAAGHPGTARAGARMLKLGGNAFDAVTAAAFASFVCELTLTSAGGGGFMTGYRRSTGEAILVDFFVNMPGRGTFRKVGSENFFPVQVNFGATHQEFYVGAASVAVPGGIAGLFEIHQRLGTLPFETVLEPAIELARGGITVNRHAAHLLALLEPILTLTEEGRSFMAPGGKLLREGDRLILNAFADTLEELSRQGPDLFYRGAIARRIVRIVQEGGGLLTAKDLEAYRVMIRDPLSFRYRDVTILTNPPPSSGGVLIGLCLKMLEGISFSRDEFLTSRVLNAFVAAMQITNAVRESSVTGRTPDRKFSDILRSEARISEYQRLHQSILQGEASLPELQEPSGGSSSTTQISVLDEEGNAASLTASNGEGSGLVIPGTGILLNNMLGEEDLHPTGFHDFPTGRRISSMMAPTIILRGAEPVFVLGSGGSNRIRSAITQSVMNLIDFQFNVEHAVSAPRIHWERGVLNREPGIPGSVATHLCRPGRCVFWEKANLFFGGVHAVAYDPETSTFSGAGDPRRGGAVISVD